jgi:M6 family metalloprotease-like protein
MPAPFVDEPFTFSQPDGTQVRVRGWGNQFEAVFETEDGYTVALDPETGFYRYAERSADGAALLPTGPRVGSVDPASLGLPEHLRAATGSGVARAAAAQDAFGGGERRWEERRRERRAARRDADAGRAAPPQSAAVGDVVGLCLLVQFPDVPATVNRQQVDDFCNQSGYAGFGNNGSVRDYFLEVSGGRLRYRNVVTAYYTAQHIRSYYTDESIPDGVRAQELIREALNHLRTGGFNFGQLSADSAGFVYALNVFYAGPRVNNWRKGLWPHSWSLASPYAAGNGRTLRDYQITDIGNQLTLRTFCHENGHMVCDYPDLYDYGPESSGVGNYCLMCYGGADTNPVHVNAYLKNEAGWSTSFTPIVPGTSQTVRTGANEFLVHSRSATEYFVIENRQQAGRDVHLPDAGLVVWHVDENGSNSNEQMTPAQHYELSLEQADGRFDLERKVNTGDTTDLYGPGQTFGDGTTPNSRWWDGTRSSLEIVDISASGPAITLKTTNTGGKPLPRKTAAPVQD